jgi:uncharacterized protein
LEEIIHSGDHMKVVRQALMALSFSAMNAMAAPATEASIKELMAVTQMQTLVQDMQAQSDALMSNFIQQALKGATPNAKQQRAIDNMKNKMIAVMQAELSWEKFEPTLMRIYGETLTEDEVAAMLAFYKTPAGQALIYKMPTVMQKTMAALPKMISVLTPKLQKIQEEFAAEMRDASK